MDKMAKLEGYEEIYNQIILKNGGWYRIRHLQSIRDLEEGLSKPRRQARSIARIVEFSCRFVPNPSRPKHLGGVTMATDIVTNTKYFQVAVRIPLWRSGGKIDRVLRHFCISSTCRNIPSA